MPATMNDWKKPQLDLLADPQAVPGKPASFVQADQQGNAISKPDFRIDFGFEDFIKAPGTPHDGSFLGSIVATGHTTDGMKKAGY